MVSGDYFLSTIGFRDPNHYKAIRDVFLSADYTDKAILEKLDMDDVPSIGEKDVALLLRKTDSNGALDTLIRLFLINVPCDVNAVKNAIQPMDLDTWLDAGLLCIVEHRVLAQIRLLSYGKLLIAFDPPRMLAMEHAHGYVMGVGKSTLTLANTIIQRQSRRTLDLGSGCGFLAFMTAGHSDRVIGVDRNSRAIEMAAFNAGINGIANVEFREGNLFQPVNTESFDLIITNPPFVISPESQYIYRDGGMQGDDLCRTIAREVPARLNDGGYCHILCNWIEKNGQHWGHRLREWFEGSGCDVWIMRSESRSAAVYASTWIRHTERARPQLYDQQFNEWMAYYESQKIESVGAGIITLRRSSGRPNWFRADEAPEKMLGPCGQSIDRGFALKDLLDTVKDDGDFLKLRLRPSPQLRMERWSLPTDGGWQDDTIRLHLAKGLAYSGTIDPYVAGTVMRCNGEVPLSELLKQMAGALGQTAESIAPSFCKITRGLVERGFLLPPDIP